MQLMETYQFIFQENYHLFDRHSELYRKKLLHGLIADALSSAFIWC